MAGGSARSRRRFAPAGARTLKLFDSTVLIAHLRGVAAATALIRQAVAADEAGCSVLSRIEIEGGMRSDERAAVAGLFSAFRLEPVTDAIARRAATHLRSHRRTHPGIDITDYVIAATAELAGADLLTLNVKHFPMIRRLKPAFR